MTPDDGYNRESQPHLRALPPFGVYLNASPVRFNDCLRDGKPEPRSTTRSARTDGPEETIEDLGEILRSDTGPGSKTSPTQSHEL